MTISALLFALGLAAASWNCRGLSAMPLDVVGGSPTSARLNSDGPAVSVPASVDDVVGGTPTGSQK